MNVREQVCFVFLRTSDPAYVGSFCKVDLQGGSNLVVPDVENNGEAADSKVLQCLVVE